EVFLAPNVKRCCAGENQRKRTHAREKTFTEEVDVLRRNQMQHRDLLHPTRVHQPSERISPDDQRGEERRQNSEGQRNRETSDRTSRLPEQNNCGDQGRHICVKDGAERFLVGGFHRYFERLTERHLFAQSLVNQHVCINGQTDGQNDAGNSGQRQYEPKHRQRADQKDQVYQKREVRDQSRQSIIDQHTHERDRESHQTGHDAGADRIQAECWRNAALFFDADRCLERVFQNAREAARFFLPELSGNNGVAAVNCVTNHWRGLNDTIEDDCKAVPFVLLGNFAELLRAFAVEFELHRPAFVAVVGVRFAHAIAAEVGFLFDEQAFLSRLFVFFRRHFVNL